MAIQSYQDLRVWQIGMDLVELVYRLSGVFPSDERFALTSQIRRAVVSIPSNIAEGHARQHRREYLQHPSIAQASLAEVETQLLIAKRLQYISEGQLKPLAEPLDALGRQLRALRTALNQRKRPPSP